MTFNWNTLEKKLINIFGRLNRLESSSSGEPEYVAKISQSGTSNPTAVVLKNTTNLNPTFVRTGPGTYNIVVASGDIRANITGIVQNQTTLSNDDMTFTQLVYDSKGDETWIQLNTVADYTGTPSLGDGILDEALLVIKQY